MLRKVLNLTEEVDNEDAICNNHEVDDTTETTSPEAAIQEMMKMFDDTGAETLSAQRLIELEEEFKKMRQMVLLANEKADSEEKKRTAMIENYYAELNECKKKSVPGPGEGSHYRYTREEDEGLLGQAPATARKGSNCRRRCLETPWRSRQPRQRFRKE